MPRYTDDQLANALTVCKGMRYLAALHIGCDHHTMNARVEKSRRLQAIVDEQTGQVLDTAELKLFDAVSNGELGAIKYLLSTKGKDRGYVERQETQHSGPDGGPLALTVTVVDDRSA